jgi:hypothetical protein
MPLNKAQLMDTPGGPGVVGAVKAGTGIALSGDGTISINPSTQVTQLVAGSNITLNPPDGFGAVTITATSSGGVTQINAGTGITVSGNTGNVTISTNPSTQVTQLVAGSNISLSPTNGFGAVTITATSSGVTQINAGTGITVSGNTGNVTISANASEVVTGITAGPGISVTGPVGNVTISANASQLVTGITAGTGITVSGSVGNVTISTNPSTQVTQLIAGSNISLSPTNGFGAVTISSLANDIPSGTIMLFMQAAAPTGWTQVTTQNNVGIRIVNTAGGGTGGTIPFSTLFSPTASYTGSVTITSGQVGDTTLSVAQLATHAHPNVFSSGYSEAGNAFGWRLYPDDGFTDVAGSSATHTHSLVGAVAGGNFSSNFALQYVDVIAASKN